MDQKVDSKTSRPHVLIFPVPAQGHMSPMLKLGELLALSNINVTFLTSERNHERLMRYSDIFSRVSEYPAGFELRTITDGFPADHPRSGSHTFMEMLHVMNLKTRQSLKEMLVGMSPPVDCIIEDGILAFVHEVAHELRIPTIYFRTVSACCFWAYFNIKDMIQAGELPVKGDEDLDRPITTVPGMPILRCRDLPSFCRAKDLSDPNLQLVATETPKSPQAHALLFNTFDELEASVLQQIRARCPRVYTIGPLHALLNTRLLAAARSAASPSHLWEVDRSCLAWLDRQPAGSVVYVSFGSVVTMPKEQLMEFWFGLVNSHKRFLWVIRPDLVNQDGVSLPTDIREGTKDRGYMVSWAPQEEVLAHQAVGGFLTHSGWNSTLESIMAGVPMICWPYFADQQVNSRYVDEVWKLGLDMKDLCDRRVVTKMVNDLMVERREEFVTSLAKMSKLAKESVSASGSSYRNLELLIEDVRAISLKR